MSDALEPDQRAADISAKRDLFNEAGLLLDEKGVFMLAVRALRIRWFGELMVAKDWETKDDLTRRLQVLTAIPGELQRFVTDYKFAFHKAGMTQHQQTGMTGMNPYPVQGQQGRRNA